MESAMVIASSKDLSRVEVDLSANSVEDVQLYVEAKSLGFQARCNAGGEVQTIILKACGEIGFGRYPWLLADGIDISASLEAVEAVFGLQHSRRESGVKPVLGHVGIAIRYDFPAHSIHFEFDPATRRLRMVTISVR
ncbi:hypothetical protein [Cupriavidus sp. TMH.W2]|uniref:hypothetical protein n=1 Tax=Cupriavidus sp. TMH.W2 TaxID=3434465 RepID=UPI003D76B343